jgi:miniconductance mechanosensitive channel
VSLTTVKIENFDKTIITVPPYSLISDSFQNWKGMMQSGGRRVMRAVNIDMSTVRFVTEQEMKQWENEPWFADFTQKKEAERPVNLTVFRHYLEYFISNYSLTKAEYLYMVRQLEPTSQGLPLEIYFFTTCQDWKEYEHVQADVIDHVLATIQSFGLRVYQLPTGKI